MALQSTDELLICRDQVHYKVAWSELGSAIGIEYGSDTWAASITDLGTTGATEGSPIDSLFIPADFSTLPLLP